MGSEKVRRRAVALVATACLFVSVPALAEPTAAEKDLARGLMAEGRKRRSHNDFPAALHNFEAADAIMHVPTTGLEVARTQVSMGLLVEARESLQRVIRIPPRAGEPAPFQDARAAADRLEGEIAKRIPQIRVLLQHVPEGRTATVSFDGDPISAADLPTPLRVNPGHHEAIGRIGPAYLKRAIDVAERDVADLTLDFNSIVDQLPPDPAVVEAAAPPPGRPSSYPKSVKWIGVGVASAGIAVGAVAGVLALSSRNRAEPLCVAGLCPKETFADLDSARRYATVSTVAFVVGGVGAATALISILFERNNSNANAPSSGVRKRPNADTAAYVAPWFGPGIAGFRGSF